MMYFAISVSLKTNERLSKLRLNHTHKSGRCGDRQRKLLEVRGRVQNRFGLKNQKPEVVNIFRDSTPFVSTGIFPIDVQPIRSVPIQECAGRCQKCRSIFCVSNHVFEAIHRRVWVSVLETPSTDGKDDLEIWISCLQGHDSLEGCNVVNGDLVVFVDPTERIVQMSPLERINVLRTISLQSVT